MSLSGAGNVPKCEASPQGVGLAPRARLSPQGVQSTRTASSGTEEHRRREVHRTVLWLPEWQVHPRASSLFAFLRPLISLIYSRLLSGHIPGGEGLCGCGGAYELAERLNEMRTQFVQCVQCPQVVRAMSPSAGMSPSGAGNVPKCEASPQAWVPCPQVRGWSSGVGALSPSARLVLRAVALPQVRG